MWGVVTPTYIVGIRVADKRPDHIIQRHNNAVPTTLGALKGIGEVMRCLDLGMTCQSNPARNNNEHDNNELDDTQQVRQPKTPFEGRGVYKECRGQTRQPDATLVPASDLDVRGGEDVLAEDDAVAGSPAEQEGIGGEHGCGQELGLFVDVLQVVLFAAVSG